jgi:purine-nucleoside phosphorylase
MPIAHAWLLNSEGEAIDPTWEVPGVAYLGVPLSTKWIEEFLASRKKVNKTEDFSIFGGNHLEKYSLLRQGLPSAACATPVSKQR